MYSTCTVRTDVTVYPKTTDFVISYCDSTQIRSVSSVMATGFNYQFGKLKLPQSLVELFSPDNKHQLVAVGVAGTTDRAN